MKTVIIDRAFEGYPDADDKPGTQFTTSEKPIEVPDEFADMIVGKGLAHFATSSAPAPSIVGPPAAVESHSEKPEGEA